MKAVILKEVGEFAIVDKPIPTITDPGDLLIRVEASSICGSDVHIFANPPGIPAVKGTTIGHELVGQVEAVGSAVQGFRPGDRLVLDNNVPCGQCISCRSGHPNMCQHMRTIGVDADGAFAEYAVVPARMAVKIPDDMPTETAIFAEPLNCVMGAMNKIRLLPGENVLVMGAGPIGLYFVKLLALNGAGKIFVSEVSPFRAKCAMECGATCVINPKEEDLTRIILEETGGIGVDVAVDAVGVLLPGCLEATRPNGRVLLFGNNSSVHETICQADITRKELTILGSYVGPHTLPATVSLLASGRLDLSHLITHRITLSQFADGMEAMRRGEAIEVVITPDC
ncbi:MAG: zinc-binding dehydrogenase [Butyricicoccus sp.]